MRSRGVSMKPVKPPIARRFEAEQDAYERIASLCLPQVVRWEYAADIAWGWHPFCVGEGETLATLDAAEEDTDYAYGYDAHGRVRVVRSHLRLWRKYPGSRPSEDFLRYSPDTIEVSEFGPKQLIAVETVTLSGGRAIRIESFNHDGVYAWTTVDWDGDRVAKYRWCVPKLRVDCERVLDERGRTREEYRVKPDGTRVATGGADKPLPKGVTLKTLAETIRTRLLKVVPKVLRAARIREKVYCLALAYDGEGGGVLPPLLGLGLERERRKWIGKYQTRARDYLWNPAHFEHYEKPHTQLNDEALEEACRDYIEQLNRRGSDSPARKLLNEVAAELGRISWEGVLDTSADFVVFAVDFEGADLRKSMKQSIPAARLAGLKAAKLV
jgi:hypothetical protein